MSGCEISPKEHLRVPWNWKKIGRSGAFRDVGKVIMVPYYHGDFRCTVNFTVNFGQHVAPLSLPEFDLKFLRWFEIISIFSKSWKYSSSWCLPSFLIACFLSMIFRQSNQLPLVFCKHAVRFFICFHVMTNHGQSTIQGLLSVWRVRAFLRELVDLVRSIVIYVGCGGKIFTPTFLLLEYLTWPILVALQFWGIAMLSHVLEMAVLMKHQIDLNPTYTLVLNAGTWQSCECQKGPLKFYTKSKTWSKTSSKGLKETTVPFPVFQSFFSRALGAKKALSKDEGDSYSLAGWKNDGIRHGI